MTYPAGSLNIVAVQDTIYNWINSVLSGIINQEQIIWRDQSEALPARPCVTMKFTYGPAPIARDGNVTSPLSSSLNVGMQMEATLSVQVFTKTKIAERPGALQLAVDLNSSLLRQSVLTALKRGGVSIQGVGKPNNLTALEETKYEQRAGFELALGMVQNISDDPGTIGTVNLAGTVGTHHVNKQINLPEEE